MKGLATILIVAAVLVGIWYWVNTGEDQFAISTPTLNPTIGITVGPTSPSPEATGTVTATVTPTPGQGGQEFNFLRSGSLTSINGAWHLRYDIPGQAGLLARLDFNSESTCALLGAGSSTCASVNLNAGMRVSVEGSLETEGSDRLEVFRLIQLTATPPPASPTPASSTATPTPAPTANPTPIPTINY